MSGGTIPVRTLCAQRQITLRTRITMEIVLRGRRTILLDGLVGSFTLFGTRYNTTKILRVEGNMGGLNVKVFNSGPFGNISVRTIHVGKRTHGLAAIKAGTVRQTSG